MRYGIYDTSLEVWVKSITLQDGIPVTESKSQAFASDIPYVAERALNDLHLFWESKGKAWMTKPLEVRELK